MSDDKDKVRTAMEAARLAARAAVCMAASLVRATKPDSPMAAFTGPGHVMDLFRALTETLDREQGRVAAVREYLHRFAPAAVTIGGVIKASAHEAAWEYVRQVWCAARDHTEWQASKAGLSPPTAAGTEADEYARTVWCDEAGHIEALPFSVPPVAEVLAMLDRECAAVLSALGVKPVLRGTSSLEAAPIKEGQELYREIYKRFQDLTEVQDMTTSEAYDELEKEYEAYNYNRATLQAYKSRGKPRK